MIKFPLPSGFRDSALTVRGREEAAQRRQSAARVEPAEGAASGTCRRQRRSAEAGGAVPPCRRDEDGAQGLVVAVPWRGSAPPFVAAIEWLARHADVAVVALAEKMPKEPQADRITFGAREVVSADSPRRSGLETDEDALRSRPQDAPLVIALPETEGRPHPQSEVELKLYMLIQADADLRPLFSFNRFVPDLPLLQAKADVVWPAGRLVVEIDGPEHRGAAKYRADRHRDYRLMLAGWRVLRMTNEDIIADAALALERIRDVVRLVQGEAR